MSTHVVRLKWRVACVATLSISKLKRSYPREGRTMTARLHVVFVCLALIAVSGLAACGHEIDSPGITPADAAAAPGQQGPATPDLLCVEQVTTEVTLRGDGFTPMPSKTLTGTVQLILPALVLTRREDISGGMVSADAGVVVPDNVNNIAASHVKWDSEQEMRFDITPDMQVAPGLYDITATNADGTHSAVFPGAFAGVPRPVLAAVTPDIACDQEDDQTMTLTGTGFLQVGTALPTAHIGGKDFPVTKLDGCKPVPGNHLAGAVQQCTTATFVLPKGTFMPGPVPVSMTNPQTAACSTTEQVTLTIVPPPSVAAIRPDVLCDAQGDETVTLTGTGFLQVGTTLPLVTVGTQMVNASTVDGCTAVTGTFVEGTINTCTSLTFIVKKGLLAAGSYPVVVTNPAPANCKSLETITLSVVPPPAVASINADLICDAQSAQTMTVTGMGFLQIGSALPSVTIGMKTYTPTAAGNCAAVPGVFTETPVSACTTLTLTIPTGDLPTGDYQVVVTNPKPADCVSSDPVYFHVAPPPSVSTTAMVQVCDQLGNAPVTILSGSATGDFLTLANGTTTTFPTVQVVVGGTPTACTVGSASGCTTVKLPQGTFVEGTVQECTSITCTLPMASINPGTYDVTVVNPAPAACHGTGTSAVDIIPPPSVQSIVPMSVCVGGASVTIHGSGFIPTPTVAFTDACLDNMPACPNPQSMFDGTNTMVNSAGTAVTTTVPPGVGNVGTLYDVTLTDPGGCHDLAPHLQIKVIQGPILYFVDPDVVYNGVNTAVTLYVTSIQGGAPAVTVKLTPQNAGTTLTFGTGAGATGPVNAVPGHPNRVQIVIPKSTATGPYDVSFTDAIGCPSLFTGGVTVTNAATITLKNVVEPFGIATAPTPITIFRDKTAAAPNNTPFNPTPRAFLNPHNATSTSVAIQLGSVSFTDSATLTAIVPPNEAVGAYDLVVINPSPGNEVGLLQNAFSVVTNPPPKITSIAPASVVATTGQALVIDGTSFRAGATLSIPGCDDATGNAIAIPAGGPPSITANGAVACNAQQVCTLNATMDASSLPSGASCVVRLTNSDGTFSDFSAVGVTGSSLNLAQPRAGTQLTTARRALVSAAANANTAAKFLYAIGGDDAVATTTPFSSVEAAPVDFFANEGTWAPQAYGLKTARSFAGIAPVGRYMYVCGGTSGAAALATCERAMVLDPSEAPNLSVADVILSKTTGLTAGYWYYRVSALFAGTDPDNPNGESLPSDEVILKLPQLTGFKLQVQLSWSPPTDSNGVALPNLTGYRLYRTAMVNGTSGQEVLLAALGNVVTFTDDDTAVPGVAKPLALGSTGQWAPLPTMSVARNGLAMTWGQDPVTPGTVYAYAFYGLSSPATANASYEYLPISLQSNGHQTVTAWKVGTAQTTNPRVHMGAWRVDPTAFASISAGNFIYVGGGVTAAGGAATVVEAGVVAAGGDLGALQSVKAFGAQVSGYGAAAGANQLFTFGGNGGVPSNASKSATLATPQPALAPGAWNANPLNLLDPLIFEGCAVQSGFIFLVGGQTAASTATRDTEVVIW